MPSVNTPKLKAAWEEAGLNDAAWEAAEDFFRSHPDVVKFQRKRTGIYPALDKPSLVHTGDSLEHKASYEVNHSNTSVEVDLIPHTADPDLNTYPGQTFSFIKVAEQIFAMANKEVIGHFLGEGAYGKVKMVQNRKKEKFAVKIENRGPRAEDNAEKQVMQALDYLVGEAGRLTGFKDGSLTQKLYTIMKLAQGHSLRKILQGLYHEIESGSEMNVQVAIKACQAVQCLHDKNIVHGDLHSGNFMVNAQGEPILVQTIDFGLARLVAQRPNLGTIASDKLPALKNIAYDDLFNSDIRNLRSTLQVLLSGHDIFLLTATNARVNISRAYLSNLIQSLEDYAEKEHRINTIVQSDSSWEVESLINKGMDSKIILKKAIILGSFSSVKVVIERYPEIAIMSLYSGGLTALSLAFQKYQIEIALYLLEQLKWHQIRPYDREDILSLIIEQHSIELLNYLIESLTPKERELAFIAAAKHGYLDLIEFFIVRVPALNIDNLKNRALIAGIEGGQIDIAQFFITEQDKAHPQGLQRLDFRKNNYPKALSIAIQNHHFEMIQFLIEDLLAQKKACSEFENFVEQLINNRYMSESPLTQAARAGNYKIIDYLINKYDPKDLYAAFLAAVENGHSAVMKSLLDKVDEKTKDIALQKAIEKKHLVMALYILKSKKDLNAQDKKQLLVLSLLQGDLEIFHNIVKENITIKPIDVQSLVAGCTTLLDVAITGGHLSLIKFLINTKHSIPPELNNLVCSSPIYQLVKQGRVDIFEWLFKDQTFTMAQANELLNEIIINNELKILQLILNKIRPSDKVAFLEAALESAIRYNQDNIIDFLLVYGAVINESQLLLAAQYGARSILYAFVNHQVLQQNNIIINIEVKKPLFYLLLMNAIAAEKHDIAHYLLDNAQDITPENYNHALTLAVEKGNIDICMCLMKKGAQVIDLNTRVNFLRRLATQGQIVLFQSFAEPLKEELRKSIYEEALKIALNNEDLDSMAYFIKEPNIKIDKQVFERLLNHSKPKSVGFLINYPSISSLGLDLHFLSQVLQSAKIDNFSNHAVLVLEQFLNKKQLNEGIVVDKTFINAQLKPETQTKVELPPREEDTPALDKSVDSAVINDSPSLDESVDPVVINDSPLTQAGETQTAQTQMPVSIKIQRPKNKGNTNKKRRFKT